MQQDINDESSYDYQRIKTMKPRVKIPFWILASSTRNAITGMKKEHKPPSKSPNTSNQLHQKQATEHQPRNP